MIRIPDAGRFEFRLADGAANPYLLQAGMLVAGLDGIDNKRDPGKRLDINMYTEGHKVNGRAAAAAQSARRAAAFEKSKVLKDGFGEEFSSAYLKLKYDDWNKYARHLTEWERDTTLDC